jgi:hypothetical protein
MDRVREIYAEVQCAKKLQTSGSVENGNKVLRNAVVHAKEFANEMRSRDPVVWGRMIALLETAAEEAQGTLDSQPTGATPCVPVPSAQAADVVELLGSSDEEEVRVLRALGHTPRHTAMN